MRDLGKLDANNYSQCQNSDTRYASRAIVIKDGLITMVYSKTKGYYKFPGGGREEGETNEQCVLRELHEETGLYGDPNSVKEYGFVTELRTSIIYKDCKFIHISSYYFVDLTGKEDEKHLEGYEKVLDYENVTTDVDTIIKANEAYIQKKGCLCNISRENYVLKLLKQEGYLK